MHAGKRTRTRTRSVTAKVTEAEESLLRERAAEKGLTLSEWSRQALLGSALVNADTRLLLSELSALRAVFLTLQLEAINGRKLTAEQVNQLVEKADREKLTMADNRIHKYQSQALPPAATRLPPGGP